MCLFRIISQHVVIKIFVYWFIICQPGKSSVYAFCLYWYGACPCLKSWEHQEWQSWMDSGTGGLSLMESLCPFVKKENEDSIVVNMLRLQQGTENERVRPQCAAFCAGLWSFPTLSPSSLLWSRHHRCPGVSRTVINGIVQLKDSSWRITKSLLI